MNRNEMLAALAGRIAVLRRPHPLRVGIDGVDAAGKTTLADELAARMAPRPVIRSGIDRFHRPAAERHRRGRDSPEGYYRDSFDTAGLVAGLLAPLGPGGSRSYRDALFDHRSDARVDAPPRRAPRDAVLLFDGVFLLRSELRACWDFTIFVQADFAVTLARAERRDAALLGGAAEVRRRYARRYVPGQRLYLEEVRPWERADVVVVNDDPARPQLHQRTLPSEPPGDRGGLPPDATPE